MRFPRAGIVPGLVILVMAIGGGVAGADHARVHDADDTRGRFDIRAVAHGHRGDHSVTHKLITYGDWRPRLLKGARSNLTFWFSTDGDKYAEFRASVDYRHGRLWACFGGYSEGSDFAAVGPCKKVPARRPNRHTVVVTLKDSFVGDGDEYGWSAESYFGATDSKKCPARNPCSDYVPRRLPRGAIVHEL
jgi:hypothetical protein